jgi:hypothetical protein
MKLIDLTDETTVKTLRVIDYLNNHRNKKISQVLEGALGESKNAGLPAQQQTTDNAATIPGTNRNDYRDRLRE